MIDPTIVLMFSGGLDSTGALYRLFTEEKYRDYNVHCHHIILDNIENRAAAETTAVANIYQYFRDNRFKFTTSESHHQYPVINMGFLWDADLWFFVAGAICVATPTVKYAAFGRTKTDFEESGLEVSMARAGRIFKAFASKAETLFPNIGSTKNEVHNILPEALRRLTWSCRRPIYVKGVPQKCGKCHTCEEILAFKKLSR